MGPNKIHLATDIAYVVKTLNAKGDCPLVLLNLASWRNDSVLLVVCNVCNWTSEVSAV